MSRGGGEESFSSQTWAVIDKYFETAYHLTKHQIDSYDDFIQTKMSRTVKALNPFKILKEATAAHPLTRIDIYVGGKDGSVRLTPPSLDGHPMYPNEARLNDKTYQSDLFADVTVEVKPEAAEEGSSSAAAKSVTFKDVRIGSIPVMLHSANCVLRDKGPAVLQELGECMHDQGGYFIVEGKEKVIVTQERIVTNRMFINEGADPRYRYEGLIRCSADDESALFLKSLNFLVAAADNEIVVYSNSFARKVPLFVLFRALGVESDADIISMIAPTMSASVVDFMTPCVLRAARERVYTQEEAYDYLTELVTPRNVSKLKLVLLGDVLPNIAGGDGNKSLFLAHIVRKLVDVCLGVTKVSDRDSYMFKRVDAAGHLLGDLFRDYYAKFRGHVRNTIDNEYHWGGWKDQKSLDALVNASNLTRIFRPEVLRSGLIRSLKGAWGIKEDDDDDVTQGLVQDLSRISYMGSISHLRRVNTPIDHTTKLVEPHRLHTSQWGVMCPCESPDGGSIGLLKNLAILCHVTFHTPSQGALRRALDVLGMRGLQQQAKKAKKATTDGGDAVAVMVNNNLVGTHARPADLVRWLKLLKRNGVIDKFASVAWNILQNEVLVSTEGGRCCRPLYVVRDNAVALFDGGLPDWSGRSWDQLTGPRSGSAPRFDDMSDETLATLERDQALIEFVDVEETNVSLIAMSAADLASPGLRKFDFCELHPSTIFGVLTHQIPLANHNQAPRNIFSGAQGKQAIGRFSTNYNNRIDTMAYMLHYPQRSIVNTRYCDYLSINDMPNGENLVVAIATYTGYNMEDSIIVNRTSVERGMFNLTYFSHMIEREDTSEPQDRIVFANPSSLSDARVKLRPTANYDTLDENGLPKVNSFIQEGDAIFGKVKVHAEDRARGSGLSRFAPAVVSYSDRSVIADKITSGVVDKVYVYLDEQKNKTAKVRFRKTRVPQLGDKSCSRHAQKGVFGAVLPQHDMPFTKDGIVPDIIINPHAIPSRMTIGHLIETVLGKAGSLMGHTIDGTPFENHDFEAIYDRLQNDYGFNRHGEEIMYSGFDGSQMATSIYIGPTYYERLKHMVADKINYRHVNYKKGGGKQAEIDAITRQPTKGRAHNGGLRIGEMEKDSLLSHGMTRFLKESLIERSDKFEVQIDTETGFIKNLNEIENTRSIEAPFAFKQLMHELTGMGVRMHLVCDDDGQTASSSSSSSSDAGGEEEAGGDDGDGGEGRPPAE
jgi:DNA-directed RNA polymerase II subunit RPB2